MEPDEGPPMSRIRTVMQSLRQGGLRSTAWRSAKWLSGRLSVFHPTPLSSIHSDDLVGVDWSRPRDFNAHTLERPASGYRVAWIISPPSRTSGGHQNAFRFMSFLERAGNPTTVYLYSPAKYPVVGIDGIRAMMREATAYPVIEGEFRVYDPRVGLDGDYDAVVACDWEAAYAAHRYPGRAKRFIFAQDFEPAFFPWGSDYAAAENSYRLGFHGFGRRMARREAAHRVRHVLRPLRLRDRPRPLLLREHEAAQRSAVLRAAADAATRDRVRPPRPERIAPAPP